MIFVKIAFNTATDNIYLIKCTIPDKPKFHSKCECASGVAKDIVALKITHYLAKIQI